MQALASTALIIPQFGLQNLKSVGADIPHGPIHTGGPIKTPFL
jgi:hypothetical protein